MVLDSLGDSLKKTIASIRGKPYIDDATLQEILKDLQRSLIRADVQVKLVFELTKNIKARIKEEKPPAGITHKEFLINILYEELVKFVGGETKPLDTTEHHPYVIMMVGLFGSGKTTTTGKLAKYYVKRGKKVLAISTDTWRPAAAEQLKTMSERAGAHHYINPDEKNPAKIIEESKSSWENYDVVLIDTAGRDALSDELLEELTSIVDIAQPNTALLVLSADIGQTAQKQAESFASRAHVRGVIITKMDGSAKGGGALAACAVTEAPVRYLGVGEDIDALEEFRPKNFIGRLLGMGDLDALLDRIQGAFKEEDTEDLAKRMLSGNMTLDDLYEQIKAMKKMGPLGKVMDMIPGMGGMSIPKDVLAEQQEKMDQYKYIIDSCTKQEKLEPEVINNARISRIATGSGTEEADVRSLLKQYKQAKKMMKQFKHMPQNEKGMQKAMQRMGKGMKGRFMR